MQGMNTNLSYVDLNRPTIFAHRGSSLYAPENTLAAFKTAITQHADGIELDVKLTVDGQVVVMHDDTVDRTTNGTGRIKSLTLKDIKGLETNSNLPPFFKSEKIPTLDEVFETVGRRTFINLELTNYATPTDDLPDKVAVLVKKFNLDTNILFSSFNMVALIKARNLLPKTPLGLLTFPGCAAMTIYSRIIKFGPLFALHPFYKDITPNLIQMAHASKCRIHTWTVNEPDIMQKLFSAGVDGIFTDDPLLAKKVLAAENPIIP